MSDLVAAAAARAAYYADRAESEMEISASTLSGPWPSPAAWRAEKSAGVRVVTRYALAAASAAARATMLASQVGSVAAFDSADSAAASAGVAMSFVVATAAM